MPQQSDATDLAATQATSESVPDKNHCQKTEIDLKIEELQLELFKLKEASSIGKDGELGREIRYLGDRLNTMQIKRAKSFLHALQSSGKSDELEQYLQMPVKIQEDICFSFTRLATGDHITRRYRGIRVARFVYGCFTMVAIWFLGLISYLVFIDRSFFGFLLYIGPSFLSLCLIPSIVFSVALPFRAIQFRTTRRNTDTIIDFLEVASIDPNSEVVSGAFRFLQGLPMERPECRAPSLWFSRAL